MPVFFQTWPSLLSVNRLQSIILAEAIVSRFFFSPLSVFPDLLSLFAVSLSLPPSLISFPLGDL